ncbi:TlpA family protein disulfide reductase [Oceanobacillus sp. CF4.6]|uniref:TlpA family protein disulfide reductase n=1 Tax=Oceanobacillus sp. CF4.6 TaxID=3373080 RepID=UPI003EE51CD2
MRIRDRMPDLKASGQWINSREIKTEDLLMGKKPTLIYFWSVSCHLCKRAMPLINQMRNEFRDKLNVISIHTPLNKEDNDLDSIRSEAARFDLTEPLFVDQDEILSQTFQVKFVPAYFIFDEEGQLRYFQSGLNGIQTLQRRLNRVLKA